MSHPIRILQVLAGMNRGGAETFIMNVYRNIDRNKVQFDFILFRKEECDYNEEIRNLGGRIFWIPRYNGKNHFTYKKAWNTFFREHPEYKIIHGHVRSTAAIYLKIANQHGLTSIAHSHSTSSRGNITEQLFKNTIQYPIRNTADYLFSCSEKAGSWLYGSKATMKDNYKLIKNAIEAEKYRFNKISRDEKRKQLNIQNKFVVGHVGTFTSPKNHTFLLDIFKEVHNNNENAILLLVGDGELRSSIEKKIQDLHLSDSVILTGVRSDIPELLQAMDIFVFPSLFEGLPVTIIEAQASGLSCIVADTITKEVQISNFIKFISLAETTNYWSDEIQNTVFKVIREDQYKLVKENGYDINSVAALLKDFYLSNWN
jgi:glycosyltransferase involved in cell wall biosynthesis